MPEIFLFSGDDVGKVKLLLSFKTNTMPCLRFDNCIRNCATCAEILTPGRSDLHLYYMLPNFIKILGITITTSFLITHYCTPAKERIQSSFYGILIIFGTLSLLKTSFSTFLALFLRLFDDSTVEDLYSPYYEVVQVAMWFDWFGDYFSAEMIFLMAFNRCIHFAAKPVSLWVFTRLVGDREVSAAQDLNARCNQQHSIGTSETSAASNR